ncbi:MAG TPA: lipid-binding protein [Puia sp.]|nr:lipid-binding protein [Puia sp.]
MRKVLYALPIIVIVFSLSCTKSTFDAGKTNLTAASNGWWVTFTLNGADVYNLGHVFFSTYNTASNTDTIWVDDLGHIWDFKVKAPINLSNLSFSANAAANEYYAITVNIANGKILPKAGKSRAGNVTDSLYMQVTFSDDSTDNYVISGTARTGFIEDDY